MEKIAIRVDGSKKIGMGHIMRCLSLGEVCKTSGIEPVFISKYDLGIFEIQKMGFKVVVLTGQQESEQEGYSYGNSKHLEQEEVAIRKILEIENIGCLVIDHYNINKNFFCYLKDNNIKVAYIDDIYAFDYPVKLVVNGNISAFNMGYNTTLADTYFALGLSYNMIRREFQNLPKRITNSQIEEILITTGGSDPYDLSIKFAKWLLNHHNYKYKKINIVIGSGFENQKSLMEIAKQNVNIQLYTTQFNVSKQSIGIIHTSMSNIMLKCDLAISTAGSTLYELCACGCIPVACAVADNQLPILKYMNKKGYTYSLGWYEDINEKIFNKVIDEAIKYEVTHPMDRQALVDGKGCKRIVDKIVEIMAYEGDE